MTRSPDDPIDSETGKDSVDLAIAREQGTMEIIQETPYRWRLPKSGGMLVDGVVYADEKMMREIVPDQSLQQVRNVAHLPGIIGASLAMPDIHWGYGFPIGGVAAVDAERGVVSPGGVGYDIN
jgi:tRNA-splicing ligase RtcB